MNGSIGEKTGTRWLNRTVLGIGLASLFSDWSHEIATTVLPAFLASMGAAAAWLGVIEGVADGLSSFAKMASGYYTDKLQRRKPIAVVGYLVTALGTASFGLATAAWHVLVSRSCAWLGRGVRTPVRKALLAAAVTKETYGRAFGFERMMDTIGAIVGPATAFVLLAALHHNYRHVFLLTLIPGVCAAGAIAFLVREKERKPVSHVSFGERLRLLPRPYRKFLVAVGIFGAGDFAPTLLILLATQKLTPTLGPACGRQRRGRVLRVAKRLLRRVRLRGGRAGGPFQKTVRARSRLRTGGGDGGVDCGRADDHLAARHHFHSQRHACGDWGNAGRLVLRGTGG